MASKSLNDEASRTMPARARTRGETDQAAATDLAREYVQFLRNNMRPDGMTQAWEWINPDTGDRANPLYVASVALPYISLKEAGLLNTP